MASIRRSALCPREWSAARPRRRGSGKTRVLTSRIARLIDGKASIRADSAVIHEQGGGRDARAHRPAAWSEPAGMAHSTDGAHAHGRAPVGRTPSYTIYDQDDSLGVVTVDGRNQIPHKQYSPRDSVGNPSQNKLVTTAEYDKLALDPFRRRWRPSVTRRCASARERADFDDLLVLPVRMLQQHPDVVAVSRAFSITARGQYQDTNRAQYIKLLGMNTATYAWWATMTSPSMVGGADIKNILDFNKDFERDGRVAQENYRSTLRSALANGDRAEHRPHGENAQIIAPASVSPWCARSTSAMRPTSW